MQKRAITFYDASKTIGVSVTGRFCELNCRHCNGRFLNRMKTPEQIREMMDSSGMLPTDSFLFSGGCLNNGAVPVWRESDLIGILRKAGKLVNIHTGLPQADRIAEIAGLADTVSLDLIGDDETILDVMGLRARSADYFNAYRKLKQHIKVVPHITIGLKGGKISGEYNAIDFLAGESVSKLVFLVITPVPDTDFAYIKPPELSEIKYVLDYASKKMPGVSMSLGCMHPRGKYKMGLEEICMEYGFDSFVNPSRALREMIVIEEKAGRLEIIEKKGCCVF